MPRGALKSSLLLVGTLGMAEVPEDAVAARPSLAAPAPSETDGMAQAIKTWARAWFDGDAEGMFACLHPDLCRHILGWRTPASPEALQRVLGVQATLGRAVPRMQAEPDVTILDAQGRSASARVDLGPWTAFVHLAAHRGTWAIANVLWEWRKA